MIVGLVGKAQSGKSTVANILTEQHGFIEVGFADALKEIALELDPLLDGDGFRLSDAVEDYGWEGAKTYPEVRRTLQNLGVAIRKQNPTFWIDIVRDKMDRNIGADFVIPDVRFPNELEAVACRAGDVWKVTRPGAGSVEGTQNHSSETALDNVEFSTVIDNSGTLADLNARVNVLLGVDDAA